jgi:hypothetical protein
VHKSPISAARVAGWGVRHLYGALVPNEARPCGFGEKCTVEGVRNVNRPRVRALVLTFGTHTVRNVNAASIARARLTKCTGKPSPPP